MDIATTLLEYGAEADAESKAGFTPLHLSAQEGHSDISSLLLEHKADPNRAAKVTDFRGFKDFSATSFLGRPFLRIPSRFQSGAVFSSALGSSTSFSSPLSCFRRPFYFLR